MIEVVRQGSDPTKLSGRARAGGRRAWPGRWRGERAPGPDAGRPVVGEGRGVPAGEVALLGAVALRCPAGRMDAEYPGDLVVPTLGLHVGGIHLVADLEGGDAGQLVDGLTGVDVHGGHAARLAPGEGGVAVEPGRRSVADGQELDGVAGQLLPRVAHQGQGGGTHGRGRRRVDDRRGGSGGDRRRGDRRHRRHRARECGAGAWKGWRTGPSLGGRLSGRRHVGPGAGGPGGDQEDGTDEQDDRRQDDEDIEAEQHAAGDVEGPGKGPPPTGTAPIDADVSLGQDQSGSSRSARARRSSTVGESVPSPGSEMSGAVRRSSAGSCSSRQIRNGSSGSSNSVASRPRVTRRSVPGAITGDRHAEASTEGRAPPGAGAIR